MNTFEQWLELPENSEIKKVYATLHTDIKYIAENMWELGFIAGQQQMNKVLAEFNPL